MLLPLLDYRVDNATTQPRIINPLTKVFSFFQSIFTNTLKQLKIRSLPGCFIVERVFSTVFLIGTDSIVLRLAIGQPLQGEIKELHLI